MQKIDRDADYYRRREARERDLSEKALDPTIKQIHAKMADRYASLLQQENTLTVQR